MAAIELRNVVKTFGPIKAVNGLNLDVPEGICLGLLGPNGAGKSTTMRLLTAQAIADSGSCACSATSCRGEGKQARAEMGVVPQLDNLDVDVTVEDNLRVFARLYRVKDVPRRGRTRPRPGPADRSQGATRSTSSRAACAGGC